MKSPNSVLAAFAVLLCASALYAGPDDYFCIEVLDEATGRGVPFVLLQATDKSRYYTDSNGFIAFNEPGLMGENVWFDVSSHGYDYPHESFGNKGLVVKPVAGGKVQIKLRRVNIAERLYRITGRGIYRDTILLGKKPPIEFAALNGKIMGQDSAFTAIYKGKLFWFWGDTSRPSHPLGNYFTTGATSNLPANGGLDPSAGIDLTYFVDAKSGNVKPMAPPKRPGPFPVWIDSLMTVLDDKGEPKLFSHFHRVKGLEPFESGLIVYNDALSQFEELKTLPLDAKLLPKGHPFRVNAEGREYFYFPAPYPAIRVPIDWNSVVDLSTYEGYTCLKDGGTYTKKGPSLDRDANGKLVWKWRKNTSVLKPKEIDELISNNTIKREEVPFRLRNADGGKPILLHYSTVYWNEYRKHWIMVGVQEAGDSYLGEVWYAESNAPEGPWIDAKKVATHAKLHENNDFYNPLQHPYFAQDGGKTIYFEGTLTHTFSGNPNPVPIYEYNQLMYRLDLSDPRLKMPEPPPGLSDALPSKMGP